MRGLRLPTTESPRLVNLLRPMKTLLPLLLASLLAAGCRVGPEHRAPALSLPHSFSSLSSNLTTGGTNPAPALEEWWRTFGDEKLNDLVARAALANLDLRLATTRIREARALAGLARSALFPQIGASGGYSRTRASENTGAGRLARAAGESTEIDLFDAGLDLSWEIDVFGGTRRSTEAARADLAASIESSRDILITVTAETVLTYLDLRGAQKELAIVRDHLRAQQETLTLTADRQRAGLTTELDAARSEAQVAATRSQIPPLQEIERQAMHRLGTLLGLNPQELVTSLSKAQPIPAAAPAVPLGLPSDLLLRRPDLRRAERELAAACARIGVAKADLFPRFFLTGVAGLQGIEASDFVEAGSRFWSIGPSIRWPVFTAGRLRQNVRVQNARHEKALVLYEAAVLRALEEVENALVSFGEEQDRHRALLDSERASARAVTLARDRQTSGLVDFLDVLEAERTFLAAQENSARSERRLGQNFVRLCKALGGGWAETGGHSIAWHEE